jgi:hypothetical protein
MLTLSRSSRARSSEWSKLLEFGRLQQPSGSGKWWFTPVAFGWLPAACGSSLGVATKPGNDSTVVVLLLWQEGGE